MTVAIRRGHEGVTEGTADSAGNPAPYRRGVPRAVHAFFGSHVTLTPAPHNEKGPVTGAFSRNDIGLPQWAGEPSGMRDHTFFLV